MTAAWAETTARKSARFPAQLAILKIGRKNRGSAWRLGFFHCTSGGPRPRAVTTSISNTEKVLPRNSSRIKCVQLLGRGRGYTSSGFGQLMFLFGWAGMTLLPPKRLPLHQPRHAERLQGDELAAEDRAHRPPLRNGAHAVAEEINDATHHHDQPADQEDRVAPALGAR